jgi:hypothetical protein
MHSRLNDLVVDDLEHESSLLICLESSNSNQEKGFTDVLV